MSNTGSVAPGISGVSNDQLAKQLADMSVNAKISIDARDRLDSAISKLIVFQPVFGTVFMFLNKIQTNAVPTMGVGPTRQVDLGLYYNPEFVMKLANKELKAVLIHEALHVLLHHIARSEFFSYGMKGFNIAADMAINCHISDLPEGCLYPKTFGLEDFQSSEWYYEKLKDQAEKAGGMDNLVGGKGDLADDHSMWGECENDVIKEKVRGIADRAIKNQDEKGWSGISDGISKAILEANKPVVNWKRELRYFINKLIMSGRKTTRTRINRREQCSKKYRTDSLKNVYLQPGVKRDYTSKLLVAIDTSGSVSDEELRAFLGEVNGMCEHVQCHVVCFDTQIHGVPEQISRRIKDYEFKGRGGTDFHPIMKYVDDHVYDGLIMLTDGYAPFPPQPKARVLWALSTQGGSVHPPYGKRLVIDVKKR